MIYRIKSLVRKSLIGEDVYFCVIVNGEGKYPSPMICKYDKEGIDRDNPECFSWGYGVLRDSNNLNNSMVGDIDLPEVLLENEEEIDNTISALDIVNEPPAKVVSEFSQKEIDWVEYYFQDILNMEKFFKLEKHGELTKPVDDLPADKEIIGIEDVEFKK